MLGVLLVSAGCTCAHVVTRDAEVLDAATADAVVRFDAPTADGEVTFLACEPAAFAAWRRNIVDPIVALPPPRECRPEWEIACRRNWQAVAPPGTYARSACAEPTGSGCNRADHCDLTSTGWICTCGVSGNCAGDEVCVSDTPTGGLPRCVSACLHETPSSMTCGADPWLLPSWVSFRPCDADAIESCRIWAQAFAPSGHSHVECVDLGFRAVCAMADHCEPPPGGTGTPTCTCNGVICAESEVCVSDTPDGVPSCVTACVPPDPMG